MNLKAFHIVFVTAATLISFAFGAWSWHYAETGGSGTYKVVGVGSFLVGLLLVAYGFWFWRKINGDPGAGRGGGSKGGPLALAALLWLAWPSVADACTVCYGEAEGPMIDAARGGVFMLFGLVALVQIAFVAFFVYLWRRSRDFGGTA